MVGQGGGDGGDGGSSRRLLGEDTIAIAVARVPEFGLWLRWRAAKAGHGFAIAVRVRVSVVCERVEYEVCGVRRVGCAASSLSVTHIVYCVLSIVLCIVGLYAHLHLKIIYIMEFYYFM